MIKYEGKVGIISSHYVGTMLSKCHVNTWSLIAKNEKPPLPPPSPPVHVTHGLFESNNFTFTFYVITTDYGLRTVFNDIRIQFLKKNVVRFTISLWTKL